MTVVISVLLHNFSSLAHFPFNSKFLLAEVCGFLFSVVTDLLWLHLILQHAVKTKVKAALLSTRACERSSQLVELSITCAPALNTSPHSSPPSCSPLNKDLNWLRSKIVPFTRRKERRRKKVSPLHPASSHEQLSWSFPSYSLINLMIFCLPCGRI